LTIVDNDAIPAIGLSPASLTFNAPVGGPNPAFGVVTVTNAGGGTLAWSASVGAAWLSMAPASGSLTAGGSQGMNVSADVTGLAAGTYNGTVTITAAGASNSPQTVSVTLNVNATPMIGLSAASLSFNAPQGGPGPAPQTLTLTNTGSGNLNWTASDDAAWLALAPGNGTLSGGGSIGLQASADVTGLAAGTYNGTVTITAAGASNSPQTVSVTLNVNATPVIGLSVTALTFSAPDGGPNPPAQTVTVSNAGAATLSWSAAPDIGWLVVSPASGSLATGVFEGMFVSVDVTGLSVGNYTGTITITAAGASNSPRAIAVSLTINARPTIGVSTNTLAFSAPFRGSNPASQSLTVSNTGGGVLGWVATDTAAWLFYAPASGTLAAGASEAMSIAVDVTGLPAFK
jgi:hypothetical protein